MIDERTDFPALLDRHEAEYAEAAAEDDLAAEFAAHAETVWAIKAIDHALARLHIAGDVRGWSAIRQYADDAADALHAAGKLAPQPHRAALLRLSARLNEALDCIGPPNGGEMEAVSAEAERIKEAIRGGQP